MNTQKLRHLKIIEMLAENKCIKVTELAENLNVSLVTIRKDLTSLENKKLLLRYQGYVKLNTETSVHRRMLSNYAKKLIIAQKAAELIEDGDTILIESGSCCILLADELKNSGKNVTIITNSTFMADYISPSTNIKLILLGGEYQPESMAVVGSIAKGCLKNFHVKYFFFGTDGYLSGIGLTGDNPERIDILRQMAQQSKNTVVITESEKFSSPGTMLLFSLDEIDILITDNEIDSNTEKDFEANNIRIIK